MKKYLLIIISVFLNSTMAQVISQFTWELNPVTQTDIDPVVVTFDEEESILSQKSV